MTDAYQGPRPDADLTRERFRAVRDEARARRAEFGGRAHALDAMAREAGFPDWTTYADVVERYDGFPAEERLSFPARLDEVLADLSAFSHDTLRATGLSFEWSVGGSLHVTGPVAVASGARLDVSVLVPREEGKLGAPVDPVDVAAAREVVDLEDDEVEALVRLDATVRDFLAIPGLGAGALRSAQGLMRVGGSPADAASFSLSSRTFPEWELKATASRDVVAFRFTVPSDLLRALDPGEGDLAPRLRSVAASGDLLDVAMWGLEPTAIRPSERNGHHGFRTSSAVHLDLRPVRADGDGVASTLAA